MSLVSSIFSQIMKLMPRTLFEEAVREHHAEKHTKGLSSWSQCIAMMFCHLGGARSLREVVGGLAASEGKLKHLGLEEAPARSSLAYANEHRPWEVYRTMFHKVARMCQVEASDKKRKFRFRHPLLSLDSTMMPVCMSMFDWAKYTHTKGAVKLHLVLDNGSFLPQYAVITDGKTGDVTAAKGMEFQAGAMLVMDRGYEDHGWWRRLTGRGVRFVTRLKDSTGYSIVRERQLPPSQKDILRDEEIVLKSEKDPERGMRLRRIEKWLEEKQDTIVFVTNDLKLAASTIADIYKKRWDIELFFKAIKQSMRIKTFIGTSENAVQTQIWTALLAMLLVRFLQLRSTYAWGLSNLIALLRQQLFVYRDLWTWVNDPFHPPVALDPPEDPQLALSFD